MNQIKTEQISDFSPNGIKLIYTTSNINQIMYRGVKNLFEVSNLINRVTGLVTLYELLLENNKRVEKIIKSVEPKFDFKQDTEKKIPVQSLSPIKLLGYYDNRRFAWKTIRGEKNYGRLCQNHRPNIVPDDQREKFLDMGWTWDAVLLTFTYKIQLKERKKNGKPKIITHVLKAVPLVNENTKELFWYYCKPESIKPFIGFSDKVFL